MFESKDPVVSNQFCYFCVGRLLIHRLKSRGTVSTRKRFSEKPIVLFTNNTVFILDFYVYDCTCLVPCFGLESLDFEESCSYSQLPGKLSPVYKYQRLQIPHQLSFSFQTIPDCIRYIIGVTCYNTKSQTNILASY